VLHKKSSGRPRQPRTSAKRGGHYGIAIIPCLFLSMCEVQGRVIVEPGNPPAFQIEEEFGCSGSRPGFASQILVIDVDSNTTVWWTKGPRRQFDVPITYGQLPDDWISLVEPEPLKSGSEYSVQILGGVGLDGTARFNVTHEYEPATNE
jgi:hypothetical protein